MGLRERPPPGAAEAQQTEPVWHDRKDRGKPTAGSAKRPWVLDETNTEFRSALVLEYLKINRKK